MAECWILAAILLLGFAIRVVFALLPRVVRWDEAAYQLIAQNLLSGRGYMEVLGARDLQSPPMVAYLSVIGLTLHLPVELVTAGVSHVLLGSLIPLPVYGLGRELYGARAGLTAALLAAIYPALAVSPLYWSTMTESPYLLFTMCGLYAARRTAFGGAWRWAITLGVSYGLAYLARPEAAVYMALMILYILVVSWYGSRHPAARQANVPQSIAGGRQHGLWRAVATSLASLVVFGLIAFPYVNYLHRATGRWLLSGKQGISMDIAWAYVNRSQAMHDLAVASLDTAGREIMWLSPERFGRTLQGWILEDPRRFVQLVRANVSETWRVLFHQDLFAPWVAALMALGLFAVPWTRSRFRDELLLLLALAGLMSLWAFFVLSRFMSLAVLVGLLWASAGLDHLAGWAEASTRGLASGEQGNLSGQMSRFKRTFVRTVPLAATAMALILAGLQVSRSEIARLPFGRLETARWLAQRIPAGTPIMARDSEVPLYAGLPMVAFPNAEWPQVLAYGRARGARYLVLESRAMAELRPRLTAVIGASGVNSVPGLTYLAGIGDSDNPTLIYALETSP